MLFARRELDVGVVGDNLYAIGGWPVAMCRINEEGQVITGIRQEDYRQTRHIYVGSTILTGPFSLPDVSEYRLFDITGREVERVHMKPGIYFLQIEGTIQQKIIKIK